MPGFKIADKQFEIMMRSHTHKDWFQPLYVKYYQPIGETLQQYSKSPLCGDTPVTEIFNRFGQKIPLSYQVCSKNQVIYIDRPTDSTRWRDLLNEWEKN